MAASALWVVMVGWWSLGNLVGVLHASAGDADPLYRECVEQCERAGQMGDISLRHCEFLSDGVPGKSSWYIKEQIYIHWNQWNCRSDCRHHCVMQSERHRAKLGLEPVKYHGKWPHRKEIISTALPALNLIMQSHGWLSFLLLLRRKLPSRQLRERACYEYAGLWHIYALLSMNAWFWSTVCHSREFFDLTEKMDYSSAVVLVGYSSILSVLRVFNLRDEASRVMVAAPFLGFAMTHICYLNFAELDYGLNMKVCNVMGMAQLLLWWVWAGVTCHPSRFKLWAAGVGGGLAMLLECYDFPPYGGYVDGHTLWHAAAIPSTYLWWSFVKDDAVFQITQALIRKAK